MNIINRNYTKKYLSFILAVMIVMSLFAPYAFAASHDGNHEGATGRLSITIYNPYFGNSTTEVGQTINNHYLNDNGVLIPAFCMNPFLGTGNTYSVVSSYTQRTKNGVITGSDYEYAVKCIAMYNDGFPAGYTDQQKKMAAQIAIFTESGIEAQRRYHPTDELWYDYMYDSASVYRAALYDLWAQWDSYVLPPRDATLGTPSNITHVHLTYDSEMDVYSATVNAGTNAQYYDWFDDDSYYVYPDGNNLTFVVPASDVESWTETYNGGPAYTSSVITGTGPSTKIIEPKIWSSTSNTQEMLTVETKYVNPTNSVQFSLYVDGADEGRPGGGGGLYGGSISATDAVAGGGSGYIGTGNGVDSGSSFTVSGDSNSVAVPDSSRDGYARITLVN